MIFCQSLYLCVLYWGIIFYNCDKQHPTWLPNVNYEENTRKRQDVGVNNKYQSLPVAFPNYRSHLVH